MRPTRFPSASTELMFDPMVRLNSQGGFTGDLAENVQRTSPTEIIFHLRQGVHFSDGRELTARDVKYTFDFVADRRNRSPKAGGFQQLARIDALDDYTIKMTTRGPYAPALEMAMLGIVPVGTPVRTRAALDAPSGTGPFKLRNFARDDRVVLERSSSPNANGVAGIVFKVVPDPTVRALELVERICDLAPNDIQPDLLPYLRAQNGLDVITSAGTTYWYLTFNFRDPALRDLRVRRAIAHAIDREEIIRAYLRGTARIASGMLTPENWAYDGAVTTDPYDPDQARKLLEAAGYKADRQRDARSRSWFTNVRPRAPEWAKSFRPCCGGWESKCRFAAMNGPRFTTTCSAVISTSPRCLGLGFRDPHHYYMVFDSRMTPPHGANRGYYSNPAMDRLVEAGMSTLRARPEKHLRASPTARRRRTAVRLAVVGRQRGRDESAAGGLQRISERQLPLACHRDFKCARHRWSAAAVTQ